MTVSGAVTDPASRAPGGTAREKPTATVSPTDAPGTGDGHVQAIDVVDTLAGDHTTVPERWRTIGVPPFQASVPRGKTVVLPSAMPLTVSSSKLLRAGVPVYATPDF